MAFTLDELKQGMSDKVSEQVVDIFLRESEILQLLPFDDCVAAGGAGSTMTYTYLRKVLPSTAEFRALNSDYTHSAATMEKQSADLKIFGGEFDIDRVLKKAEGRYNNMAFQMEEKIKAAVSLFHYTLINGNSTSTNEFDGLDKMLIGTTSEYNTGAVIDLSNMTNTKSNADQFYEELTKLIRNTNADALLLNTDMITKIQTVARLLGYKTESEEAFGRRVTIIDGVRMMDLKNHYTVSNNVATANPVVKKGISRTVSTAQTGLTDIYAVKFDVNDGFHGITLSGGKVIDQYLPDFSQPGVVKKGEVEMVAACVLKNTANAGVLRNIKLA
jgi:hypothetical protein